MCIFLSKQHYFNHIIQHLQQLVKFFRYNKLLKKYKKSTIIFNEMILYSTDYNYHKKG